MIEFALLGGKRRGSVFLAVKTPKSATRYASNMPPAHDPASLTCPHCGEPIDTYPDPGGGDTQIYVEDCSVCCRPISFHAEYSHEDDEYRVQAHREV